jgi:hypothetical protein
MLPKPVYNTRTSGKSGQLDSTSSRTRDGVAPSKLGPTMQTVLNAIAMYRKAPLKRALSTCFYEKTLMDLCDPGLMPTGSRYGKV